jgi:hypothetical protein
MIGAEFINDSRSRSRFVADDLSPGPGGKFLDNLYGEPIRVKRKGFGQDQTGHFPVAGGGIFSGGLFGHFPENLSSNLARHSLHGSQFS